MEKYLHYTLTDYIDDESFVRWAKGLAQVDDFDWTSFLEKNEEQNHIAEEAKLLVQHLKFKKSEAPTSSKSKVWDAIQEAVDTPEKTAVVKELKPKRFSLYRRIAMGAAACIAVVFVAISVMNNFNTSTVETSFAEAKTFLLPDQSNVKLNSKSAVEFNSKKWDKERIVQLEGEAFFRVKKGSKFTVETDNGTVEVLGTSFNVFSRDNILTVLCETGKVQVRSGKISKTLLPNQSVRIENEEISFEENIAESNKRSSWMKGVYQYTNQDLEIVLNDLERELNVEFEMDNSLKEKKFTGSFDVRNKEESITEVLWPLGLTQKKEGNKIYISEK